MRTFHFLRSRCDLVPEDTASANFEIVRSSGRTEPFSLDFRQACDLTKAAVDRAASLDVRWREKDLVLEPQAKLVELVKLSRQRALRGEAEAEAGT